MEKYKIINNEYPDNAKKLPIKLILCVFIMLITYNISPYNVSTVAYKRKLLQNNIYTPYNKYYISKYINNSEVEYFNVTYIKYVFSFKFKVVQVEYNVVFYDKKDNIIPPSNLTLFHNIHLICHIDIKDSYTNIDTVGYNYHNQYYTCREYFNLHEKITFAARIYQIFKDENDIENDIINYYTIYLFTQDLFDFKNMIYLNDDLFDPYLMSNIYLNFVKDTKNKNKNETLKLKKLYMEYPNSILKRHALIYFNKWSFRNVYNHHFCGCKGFNCLDKNVASYCKFHLYLNVMDDNKDLYPKTEYLFVDFYFNNIPVDNAYPIFKEMESRQYQAHYITEREEIYYEHCKNLTQNKCLKVIKVNRDNYTMTGEFLETYIEMFLRLKAVVAARGVRFVNNVFYYTPYITYIFIGNGLYYFKPFLYSDIRDTYHKRFDKILLPKSEKIVSLIKETGWTNDEIIKINFPKWQKYYIDSKNVNKQEMNRNIVIYFNPRDVNKDMGLSPYYTENIIYLVNNRRLIEILEKNNITMYLAFYYTYNYRKSRVKRALGNKTHVQIIEQDELPNYITNASLFISDYSTSIIDMIYMRKPIIIYIPDAYEPNLTTLYKPECHNVILSIINGTTEIENKYFTINGVVDRINYYIENNFKLDRRLKEFYNTFKFKNEKGLDKFIDYLKNLK